MINRFAPATSLKVYVHRGPYTSRITIALQLRVATKCIRHTRQPFSHSLMNLLTAATSVAGSLDFVPCVHGSGRQRAWTNHDAAWPLGLQELGVGPPQGYLGGRLIVGGTSRGQNTVRWPGMHLCCMLAAGPRRL